MQGPPSWGLRNAHYTKLSGAPRRGSGVKRSGHHLGQHFLSGLQSTSRHLTAPGRPRPAFLEKRLGTGRSTLLRPHCGGWDRSGACPMNASVSDATAALSRPLPLANGNQRKSPRGAGCHGRPATHSLGTGTSVALAPRPAPLQPRELPGVSRQVAPRATRRPWNGLMPLAGGVPLQKAPEAGPALPRSISRPPTTPSGTLVLVIHKKPQARKAKLQKPLINTRVPPKM